MQQIKDFQVFKKFGTVHLQNNFVFLHSARFVSLFFGNAIPFLRLVLEIGLYS